MKRMMRAASAVILVIVLVLSMTSCVNVGWVVSAGDYKVSPSFYQYYLVTVAAELLDAETYDTAEAFYAAEFDGLSCEEYIKQEALKRVVKMALVQKIAAAEGVTVDASVQQNISDYITNMKSSYDSYYGSGYFQSQLDGIFLDEQSYFDLQVYYALEDALMEHLFRDQATDEALESYFPTNFARVKHILFKTIDDSYASLGEEAVAEKKASAEAAFADLKNAVDAVFEEKMKELTEDVLDDTNSDGYVVYEGSNYIPEFVEAGLSMEVGETVLIESSYGFHIIRKYPVVGEGLDYMTEYHDNNYYLYLESLFEPYMEDQYRKAEGVEYNKGRIDKVNIKATLNLG